jgi:hypothetical protein
MSLALSDSSKTEAFPDSMKDFLPVTSITDEPYRLINPGNRLLFPQPK